MKPYCQSFWFISSLSLFWLATTRPTLSQIVPDTTLPNPSIVTSDGNTTVITGGTQAGFNLFHSFNEFSVPTGGVASFQGVARRIENVISRVTGVSVSNIDGMIEVLRANGRVSPANFFLLNSNGIIFGSEASLNVGGSFLASTASSLIFADGTEFSATAPQTPPLLSVSVPIGLQFGTRVGDIQNQSQATNDDGDFLGLQVQQGKTLALVGGNINIDGGYLVAPGGRIELGAMAGSGTVGLNVDGDRLRLSFPDTLARSDISLTNSAAVDASDEGGGDIQLHGRRVTLTDGSQVGAFTLGSKPGGTIAVNASELVELSGTSTDGDFSSGLISAAETEATGAGSNVIVETRRLTLRDGAQIRAVTYGAGAAGNLTVRASDSVDLVGSSVDGRSRSGLFNTVEAEEATGAGGHLTIDTGKLSVRDGARVNTATFGQGNAGNLTVRATDSVEVIGQSADRQVSSGLFNTVEAEEATGAGGDLTIVTGKLLVRDEGQVTTSTFGQGNAGNLTVQATQIELEGYGISEDGRVLPSSLSANAEKGATGTGGNLTIEANRLSAQNGAQVSVTTFSEFSQAKAGNLTVRTSDIELVGVALSPDGQFLTSDKGLSVPSGLFAGTGPNSSASGGKLSIETDRLSLQNGAYVQTSTLGAGDAGDLSVQAKDLVELVGTSADRQSPTSLLAVSGGTPDLPGFPEATGKGGNLTVETGRLIVQDEGKVTVSSLNPTSDAKGAGNLQITARTIQLDNQGQLKAETASGDGGNISLQVQDFLLLRRNSNISTTAGRAGTGGNGGNITIDAEDGFLVAVPSENSDISANAFESRGGSVTINAQSIFGLVPRSRDDLVKLLGTDDPTQLDPRLLPTNDITAISQRNPSLSGVVTLNTPDVDPSRGLATLPTEVVDASNLVASGCSQAVAQRQSKFVVTGRGGLPDNPSEVLSSDTVWSDLRLPTTATRNPSREPSATQPANSTPKQLVEAQGWVINEKGQVVLTAQAVPVVPHSSWQTTTACPTQ
jgi:filamentous hemagglutinin family protein